MKLSPLARSAAANAVTTLLSAGELEIRSESGTLLATLAFAKPAFDDAVDGRAVSRPLKKGVVLVDGQAASYRAVSADGKTVLEGDVRKATGKPNDDGFTLNDLAFRRGAEVEIMSMGYRQPEGE